MDTSCKFGLQYRPLSGMVDPVARLHVSNCSDCRQQVRIV